LIVALILSAQCKDERVNATTKRLFKVYPTLEDLAKADPQEVYSHISNITYPINKSEYLVNMANILINKYDGKIPDDADELPNFPGVGRKTANLILSTLYDKPKIAVDTHVFRVAKRIGLVAGAKTPLDVEKQLSRYFPKDYMSKISRWLIWHGRDICTAKDPKCYRCRINKVCVYYHEDMWCADIAYGK
jgi:endonuclease-3